MLSEKIIKSTSRLKQDSCGLILFLLRQELLDMRCFRQATFFEECTRSCGGLLVFTGIDKKMMEEDFKKVRKTIVHSIKVSIFANHTIWYGL